MLQETSTMIIIPSHFMTNQDQLKLFTKKLTPTTMDDPLLLKILLNLRFLTAEFRNNFPEKIKFKIISIT